MSAREIIARFVNPRPHDENRFRYSRFESERFADDLITTLTSAGHRIVGPGYEHNIGDRVTKKSGASWTGRVVGFYSTSLTSVGYAIESENEPGSVQIYPEAALALMDEPPNHPLQLSLREVVAELEKAEAELRRSNNAMDASTFGGRNRTDKLAAKVAALRSLNGGRDDG